MIITKTESGEKMIIDGCHLTIELGDTIIYTTSNQLDHIIYDGVNNVFKDGGSKPICRSQTGV